MPNRVKLSLCLVSAALALIAQPAAAHLTDHRDPDDYAGKLDIKLTSIDVIERRGKTLLKVTVRTFERFRKRDLYNSGFLVNLDSRGDNRRDFTMRMDLYENHYPYCTLYDRDGFSRASGVVDRDARSFSCTVQRSFLRPNDHIRWQARSFSYSTVGDLAPQKGWYRH